jgi:cobalt-zinc-cadmium efflux system outer membrane protein
MSFLIPLLLSAAVAPRALPTERCGPVPGPAVESSNPDDPALDLTLARALEILAGDSPRTAAVRSRVGEARADLVAAKVLPNPALDYAGTRLRSGTNTGAAVVDQVGAEWPILVFGQRKARSGAATSGIAAMEAHVAADLAERARDVRSAFGDLLAQQERTCILEEARADLERVAKIVAGRENAGEASDYESLRVQTEFRAMDALLGDARGDLADARGRLAVLLGRPGTTPRAVGELQLDTATPLDLEALWAIALQRLPALSAAQKDEEAASAAVHAARRDALPVPVLSGGVELTQDAQSRSATFGISIPLPILDRNQGAIARAQVREDEAVLERKAIVAETRADLERAVEVAAERRAALAEIDASVSTRLPEMRSMAEAAYREGRGDILELLDAFRSLTATRLARVDAFAGAAHADADLLFLTGRAMDTAP